MLLLELYGHEKREVDPIESTDHSALPFEGLHMISLTGLQDLFS